MQASVTPYSAILAALRAVSGKRHGRQNAIRMMAPMTMRYAVVPCAPTSGNSDLANDVPMHSEAMAPISDSVGIRVEADVSRPEGRVAAVMMRRLRKNQGFRVEAVE